MPTPNEIPGVSLIDRLQAENKRLKDENTDLQKSVGKLELFNKILEREIAELKTPNGQEPVAREVNLPPTAPEPPIPVKKIATYVVIVLLVIASLYAIASLFGKSKPSVDPPVTETTPAPAPPAPPANKSTVIPTTPVTGRSVVSPKPASSFKDDTSRRRRALMEDHTPYDSVAANDFSLGHFKVLSRAYFHNKPDSNTRNELYINHLTRTTLEALDEKNGFVFVVFKNQTGRVTRGWLRKIDLKEVPLSDRY